MNKFRLMIMLQIILAVILFSFGMYIIFFGTPQKMPDTEIFLTNTTIVGQMISSVI